MRLHFVWGVTTGVSFYLQAGSKSEGTTPIRPTGKDGDILRRKRGEMFHRQIRERCKKSLTWSLMVYFLSKCTRWRESRFIAKNPFPTGSSPVVTFAIQNGEIFKLGGPIGNLPDKREIPLRRIIAPGVIKAGSKNSECN